MSVKQTKCPFCGCEFYITSLQLNAYRGQARCGECHQVFDATSNLVDEPLPTSSDSDQEPASQDAQLVEQTEEASSANPDEVNPPQTTPLALDAPQSEPDAPSPTTSPNVEDEHDLRFSDDQGLGHDIEDTKLKTNSESSISMELGEKFDSQFLEQQQYGAQDPLKTHHEEVEKLHKAADDSWIENLLEDDKAHPQTTITRDINHKQDDTFSEIPVVLSTAHNVLPEINDSDEDLLSYLNRTGVTTLSNHPEEDLIYAADQKPAQHRILRPTPKPVDKSRMIGWGIMCLMMFGLLITQFMYFNFEKLAFNPTTSVYIKKICALSECSLPYMNEDELHIKKVRLSSNGSNLTTFTARLVNSARLSQPFPALKLTLKRDGKVVASQIIQPRQYLPENLKTFSRITSKTPYPIQFTIKYKKSDIQDYTLVPEYN